MNNEMEIETLETNLKEAKRIGEWICLDYSNAFKENLISNNQKQKTLEWFSFLFDSKLCLRMAAVYFDLLKIIDYAEK